MNVGTFENWKRKTGHANVKNSCDATIGTEKCHINLLYVQTFIGLKTIQNSTSCKSYGRRDF